MSDVDRKICIFYSYAHEDKKLVEKLINHMGKEYITWYDGMIPPGEDWNKQIEEHLNAADIILLVISDAFMGSDFCYNREMRRAMERWEAGEANVIPIILIPMVWEYTLFGRLQALPTEAKPVSEWTNPDEACKDIVVSVRQIVHEKLKKQYIFAAEEYCEKEKYEGAINAYKNALLLFPSDPILYKNLGDTFCKCNDFKNALNAYKKASDLNMNDIQLYLSKGDVLCQLGQFGDALITYEEALSFDRANALLCERKGDMLFILNDLEGALEEALKMYDQAIALNQSKVKLAELLEKKASIYANLVKINSVMMVEAYRAAMENSSKEAGEKVLLLRNEGNKLVALGLLEKALAVFDEAIQIGSDNAYSHKERGDVLWRINRLPEAFVAYEQAIHLKPDFELAREGRRQVLVAMETQKMKYQHIWSIISEKKTARKAYDCLEGSEDIV
jgi:tetratricopeptide (TPR) repeat protein